MILDTNAVSDLFAGNEALAKALGDTERHHLPVLVLGEYRYGLLASRQRRVLEALLETLEKDSVVLSPDRETAIHYAAIRRQLREDGQPLPENDVWIAALARQHSLSVVTRDAHFDKVRGLGRVTWSS